MFWIDEESFDLCFSYANTLDIDIYLGLELPNETTLPSFENDRIYASVMNADDEEVFGKIYPIVAEETNEGTAYKWTLRLNHEESGSILPGDYTWDFTYYKDAVISEGRIIGGSVVDTPFCEKAKAMFKVQATNSTQKPKPAEEPEV